MITRVIYFTEYWFVPIINGTDHLEGNQFFIEKELGKGVVYFHNKKGGVLRLMFLGEPRMIEKAAIISKVEEVCDLKFINQQNVHYLAEYENNLRSMFGDKLIIK